MRLMLVKEVEGLGLPGDVVTVAAGYARNYLLPRRLAAPVSKDTMKQAEAAKKKIVQREAEQIEHAKAKAEALSMTSVTVEARAGEAGQLYGSVTAAMVAEAIQKEGYELDAHWVHLAEPIKELGIYDVPIRVHAEVETTVKVYVVEPPPAE